MPELYYTPVFTPILSKFYSLELQQALNLLPSFPPFPTGEPFYISQPWSPRWMREKLCPYVGSSIAIPPINGQNIEIPKYFSIAQLSTHLSNFYLTETRFQVLSSVIEFAAKGDESSLPKGFIPRGVQGVGKSILVAAMASVAQRLGHLILYQGSSKWSLSTSSLSIVLAEAMLDQNPHDKLKEIPLSAPGFPTITNALDALTRMPQEFDLILNSIAKDGRKLFFFMDEHNEIYKAASAKGVLDAGSRLYKYCRPDLLRGNGLFVVICGSSHSKFIQNELQGVYDAWLVDLLPLTRSDLIGYLASSVRFAAVAKLPLEVVLDATGGVFREVEKLHEHLLKSKDNTISSYIESRAETIKRDILKHWSNKEDLLDLLSQVLFHRELDLSSPTAVEAFDEGWIIQTRYTNGKWSYMMAHRSARRAFEIVISQKLPDSLHLGDFEASAKLYFQQNRFEKIPTLESISNTSDMDAIVDFIAMPSFSQFKYFNEKTIPQSQFDETYAYYPMTNNKMSFDFLIFAPSKIGSDVKTHRLYFFQVSKLSVRRHEDGPLPPLVKAFMRPSEITTALAAKQPLQAPPGNKLQSDSLNLDDSCLVAKIVKGITGFDCVCALDWTLGFDVKLLPPATASPPDDSASSTSSLPQLDTRFFFITQATLQTLHSQELGLKRKGRTHFHPTFANLRVLSTEYCSNPMNFKK